MISIARPLLGAEEQEAMRHVLASAQLAQGAQVAAFEQHFAAACQTRDAIAVTSGTAALHLALLAHGVGPGDEVITTPFSFAATANAIILTGARPVFVDIDPTTYTLDPANVEAAITPRTRALLPVHLYGHPADMPRLARIAAERRLAIIEDACQAHAATIDGKPVGGFGSGCFSFYSTKNMTTGEGGMVTTNDPEIAERVRLLRNHGQRQRYQHIALGYNQRMTDMQAALGLAQLAKLERFTARRITNAERLTACLSEYLPTPVTRPGYRHVFHQYTVRIPQGAARRDEIIAALAERGVGSAVHYPLPIHQQPFYRAQGYHVSLPIAEQAAQQVLSLPVHPGLTDDEVNTVAREVIHLCQRH